jgi:hypothetical protein
MMSRGYKFSLRDSTFYAFYISCEKREHEVDLRRALTSPLVLGARVIVYLTQNPRNVLDNVRIYAGQLRLCAHYSPAHLYIVNM